MNSPIQMSDHHYFDRQFQLAAVKIFPGEFHATNQSRLLVTLLGSCVAVCLCDKVAKVAGMNHFLLPEGTIDLQDASAARFGVHAMELLITDMQKLGAMRHRLEAKVFGAGNVLAGMSMLNIGERNVAFIHRYLSDEHIPVLAEDLLGNYARKVCFFTESGKVLIKKLKRTRTAVSEETHYRQKLQNSGGKDHGGEIELFL
ncbi:chemoreceptor glutamine deamidase CheD [Neisseriaceae bacterium TC5R-5]|nr:chemoreceptor glutamine deamidase CheD [Neisseriaceae bacterium TC5R-5]